MGELSAALNLIQDMQRAHEIMRVELSRPLGVVMVVISLQLSPLRNYCPIVQLITGGSDGKWEQQTHMGGSIREGEGLITRAPDLMILRKLCG